jgi:uncharacterized protein YndB with AHSA1/START domain
VNLGDSVTVSMKAPAQAVWALVSDVTRIGEFSPETFEAEWLRGATGPAEGAEFRGHVKRNGIGPVYWTVCRVERCVPGHEFAFTVLAGKTATNTWAYTITPTADGCDVTESFELPPSLPMRLYWAVMGRWRGKTNVEGMRTTLERIKAVVENPSPAA